MSIEEKLSALRNHYADNEIEQLLTAAALSAGVMGIARERLRQITAEGYTAAHDDDHPGEMALAGSAYAENAVAPCKFRPDQWPWEPNAWKPGEPEGDLEKAGALVAAEIDSIIRRNTRMRDCNSS